MKKKKTVMFWCSLSSATSKKRWSIRSVVEINNQLDIGNAFYEWVDTSTFNLSNGGEVDDIFLENCGIIG